MKITLNTMIPHCGVTPKSGSALMVKSMGPFKILAMSVALLVIGVLNARATPVYDSNGVAWDLVGSWHVGDGPGWTTDPAVYSGIDAATLLFGALPAGEIYATSTTLSIVNHLAFYDAWGDTSHLTSNPLSESLHIDVAPAGYEFPGGGDTAYSAYVQDHSGHGGGGLNYAFVAETHVPDGGTTAALIGSALLGLAALRRRFARA
jgi:hypothetical protein